jgi:hypothetical protein
VYPQDTKHLDSMGWDCCRRGSTGYGFPGRGPRLAAAKRPTYGLPQWAPTGHCFSLLPLSEPLRGGSADLSSPLSLETLKSQGQRNRGSSRVLRTGLKNGIPSLVLVSCSVGMDNLQTSREGLPMASESIGLAWLLEGHQMSIRV